MRKIYTIGETVLDIVFKNDIPVTAKAGGSMLNTAVSLGRMGLPIHFISEYGTDEAGQIINDFLAANGTDTQHVYKYSDGKSALALAFLDEKNNARYSFYKAYPPERLKINFPEINKDDILMFGSFYGVTSEIREILRSFLKEAQKRQAIIIYDPNFRKSHLFELDKLRPAILENLAFADIVRCSDEDVNMIFNTHNCEEAFAAISPYCTIMIYTSGPKDVTLRTKVLSQHYPVEQITPLSTIGAGDSFNAGLISGLFNNDITREELTSLTPKTWQKLIEQGIAFSTAVCQVYENYIPLEFAKTINNV